MTLLDSGKDLGQQPSTLGADWKHREMYDEYVNLWNHFNNVGLGEIADEMTLNMEKQYSVPGGTLPMLNSFKDISQGGTGGYSPEDFAALTGGVNPVDGSAQAVATTAQAPGSTHLGSVPVANTAATAATIGNGVVGAANTIADPNKDAAQKTMGVGSGALGTLGALGVGGMAVPVLGAALGVGGAVYDYNKQQEAEINMQNQLRKQEQIRDIASAKYNKELDNEYARRELGFRGQTQVSPLYQSMMANAGKNYANQQQANVDMAQKQGFADNSGALAQMASQNFGDMSNAIGKATKDTLTNQPRAYGGLSNLANSTSPEMNQYGMSQNMYNESKDFGSNLSPLANMAGAYAKSKFRDAGMESMYNDYYDNKAGI